VEWGNELGAFAAYVAIPMCLAGLVVTPLMVVASSASSSRIRTLGGAVAGAAGVTGGLIIVSLVSARGLSLGAVDWVFGLAGMLPATFIGLPAIWGAVTANLASERRAASG
jgi:hypothetical protein